MSRDTGLEVSLDPDESRRSPATPRSPEVVRGEVALLAYLEGEGNDEARHLMRLAVAAMSIREGWAVASPQLVDEGDESDWTVGVLLWLPRPSTDERVERRALDDVEAFIATLEGIGPTPEDIALEMDGEVIGWIAQGARDGGIERGLLEPWRRRCGQ